MVKILVIFARVRTFFNFGTIDGSGKHAYDQNDYQHIMSYQCNDDYGGYLYGFG